ncbi:unnamed protein product, partial [Brenthis ino]
MRVGYVTRILLVPPQATKQYDTNLAGNFAARIVNIEKDLRKYREQFYDIVPLAPVILKEPLVKLIEGRKSER